MLARHETQGGEIQHRLRSRQWRCNRRQAAQTKGIRADADRPHDQEAAAVFLLGDLRNWLEKNMRREVPFYFIQGTEYHDGRGAEELESIAARIEGANIESAFVGRHCKVVLDLDIDGVALNFAHTWVGAAGSAAAAQSMRKRSGHSSPAARDRRNRPTLSSGPICTSICTSNTRTATPSFARAGSYRRDSRGGTAPSS